MRQVEAVVKIEKMRAAICALCGIDSTEMSGIDNAVAALCRRTTRSLWDCYRKAREFASRTQSAERAIAMLEEE